MVDVAGPQSPERSAKLVYSRDEEPGIRRRRSGRGFSYRDPSGKTVADPETLDRIRRLAIPPAWTEVWINPDPQGHIQATGRDARGRKQYRYHDTWIVQRAETKYSRLADFGRALPSIRARVETDLDLRGPRREKVLATCVRLLEITQIRIGNREYARANRSYGLTTLNKRHVDIDGSAMIFHFKGKSGIEHRVSVRDRRLARILSVLEDLPGQHLFKYRDENGDFVPVEAADVNAYLREIAGQDFSAKDFRTWAGTISAARALRTMPPPSSKTEGKRIVTTCIRAVAGVLGNTAAVCRSSYVHPAVLDAFHDGRLSEHLPEPDEDGFEEALIALLENAADAPAAKAA